MAEDESGRVDWKLMLPLILGNMMNPLNSTMLATALVTICTHFSKDISAGALLVTPLYIAATIGQPLMGRLADMYNPKTINKIGIITVLAAALVGTFANDFSLLIVSRVLFGIGTSAAFPSSMAIISHKYGQEGRAIPGNILGIITVSSQVSLVLGPLLGGFLTEALGWNGVFIFNIPWALLTLYFSKDILSLKRRPPADGSVFKKTDAMGVTLFSGVLTSFLLLFVHHSQQWLYLAGLVLCFIAFIIWERKQSDPFIDIRLLWAKPSLLLVYVRTLATNYILYLLLYALPQWVEAVKMMSPAQTGLIILPMTFMSAISAIAISRLRSAGAINNWGVLTMMLTCAAMFLLNHSVPVWEITLITLLCGTAMGINIVANQASLSEEAPSGKTGVSFGLYRTFGYLGALISGMQLKTIFSGGATDLSIRHVAIYASLSCVVLLALYYTSFKKLASLKE